MKILVAIGGSGKDSDVLYSASKQRAMQKEERGSEEDSPAFLTSFLSRKQ